MHYYIFIFFSDTEFIYKDEHGGVTLFDAENLTTSTIMTNITFVSTTIPCKT